MDARSDMAGSQVEPPRSADFITGPLTFTQRRIWLRDQLAPAGMESQVVQARITGSMEAEPLRSALAQLVRRHAILRTTFHSDGGDPQQRIWNLPLRPPLAELDLSEVPRRALERRIDGLLAAEARQPFNLAMLPLGRCLLVERGDGGRELLLTLHRITADDSSVEILADDLRALYAAELERGSSPERLPPQLVDAALRELQCADAVTVRERLAFWQQHLDGASPRIGLRSDFAPGTQGVRAAEHVVVPLRAEVIRAAADSRQPAQVLLVAAWAILLSRLSAASGVVMGRSCAHRRQEFDTVIGPLDDCVPLHIRDCEDSVARLADRIAADLAAIDGMEYTPPEWIVAAVQGGLTGDALNQWMVRIDTGKSTGEPGWSIHGVQPAWLQAPGFELALHIRTGPEISAALFYAPHRFSARSVRELANRLVRLLRGMLADIQAPAGGLPLVSPAERRRIVVGLNSPSRKSRRGRAPTRTALLHGMFEDRVRRTPGRVALVCANVSMTYRELDTRANRLAHYLRAMGLAPDGRIAICMPRSVEMIVAMLGVLKAGGAYVPLDPHSPADRLRQILADSGAMAMIAPGSFRAMCADIGLRLVDPGRRGVRAAIAAHPGSRVRQSVPRLRSSNLAYVIYTSGSTGAPKGVLVEHRHVVSATVARIRHYGRAGRSLLISPIAFDSSVAVIYGSLASGGTLFIATDTLSRDARGLARKIVSERIECVLTVPEFLRQIVDELGQIRRTPAGLRLVTAGEACPKSLVESAARAGLPLFNEYGPTEGTVWATVHECTVAPGPVPIGRPIDGAKIYILDAAGNPVPIGVVGEIHIGGNGVARGYLNRPALSEERFVPDPFDGRSGARMYRTGDLGRWLRGGDIEFCGRRDSQVKVRGHRIELEDIESHLTTIEGVDAAAVTWEERDAGSRRLVAYVVCGVRGRFRPKHFDGRLSRQLPAYMLPAAYVRLDSLPVTRNGKIDRAALPGAAARSAVRGEYSAPRGPRETLVADLWKTVLGVPRAGRHDNFFQLGGDSLNANRLVDLCRKSGARVGVHDLFKSPTLAEFARLFRGVKRGSTRARSRRPRAAAG